MCVCVKGTGEGNKERGGGRDGEGGGREVRGGEGGRLYTSHTPLTHFNLNPKPECHYAIFVNLTPEIEDGEDKRRAEDHQTEEERDDHETDRVEDQHEEIVCWLTTEVA